MWHCKHQSCCFATSWAVFVPFLLVLVTITYALADQQLFGSEPSEDFDLLPSSPYDYRSQMPVITKRDLASAVKVASERVRHVRDTLEPRLLSERRVQVAGTWPWLASSLFHKPAPEFELLATLALISEETTKQLASKFNLTRAQISRGLPQISVEATSLGRSCPRAARLHACFAGRFRSLSGQCNNVQSPDWAAADTPFARYAPAQYADHVNRVRRAVRGTASAATGAEAAPQQRLLPSAAAVAEAIFSPTTASNPEGRTRRQKPSLQQQPLSHLTTMMSFFGQFVTHDLMFVRQYSGAQGSLIKCCDDVRKKPLGADSLHPECLAVLGRDSCLDYVRSTASVRPGCNLGPREQLNAVTGYLDGSTIYGSSERAMRRLRAFSGGRLRTSRVSGAQPANRAQHDDELLPLLSLKNSTPNNEEDDPQLIMLTETCKSMGQLLRKSIECFDAGDLRAGDNIGLTLMHTIWMREHNRVANKLSAINKHWQDERLFEEARRIVIAQLQHITYSEFLPAILGEDVMNQFNLTIKLHGYSLGYEPLVNAAISNEVATSLLLPFIRSTIPSSLERYSERLEMLGTTNVADTFMDGSELFGKLRFGQYLTGLISQNAMEPTSGFVAMPLLSSNKANSATRTASLEHSPLLNTVSNFALSTSSRPHRRSKRQLVMSNSSEINNNEEDTNMISQLELDAVALTIQQGRDHGLASYIYWRNACHLKPLIKSWQDLRRASVLPDELVKRLEATYASIDDIDLFVVQFESPMPGASVGPTIACLLARQFYSTKHGDRYWYENDMSPDSAFTLPQLEQLRATSLAGVVCRNSESTISFIQPSPMLSSDPFLNAYQYCSNKNIEAADIDLEKWREPVTSAQQVFDEMFLETTGSLSREKSLARGRELLDKNAKLAIDAVQRAKRDLNSYVEAEAETLKASNLNVKEAHYAAYRYLKRPKRELLQLNNESLVFELATNELVRSLIRAGRDRENNGGSSSAANDVRDFLANLETLQLDNLISNSEATPALHKFIASAGSAFFTPEQRQRLKFTFDDGEPSAETLAIASGLSTTTLQQDSSNPIKSSSIFESCQDNDLLYPCDHTSPYRTMTGWCNNLLRPKFGQSFTQLDRLLPSSYDDGLAAPRLSSSLLINNSRRKLLPSPRLVSTVIHDASSDLHARYSLALMQFGQFGVDHDLTRTPFAVSAHGELLDCSSCDSQVKTHKDCLPIHIPSNDAHFESAKARNELGAGKKCLHFVRSLNGQRGLGPRQQLNALTSYLDGSEIYGSDNCEAKSLRTFVGGRLNSSSSYAAQLAVSQQQSANGKQRAKPKEMLPSTQANLECVTPSGVCFHAGDQRASEQPALTAIHTIFLRLHNSIVDKLALINKHWSDEKLYQQGRRIVAAILQRITYNEFAPRLLGLDYMSKFNLILKNVGYSDDYDDSCSSSIFTEFAAAAFRMGHSLIRNAFPLLDRNYKQIGKSFQLRTAFFNSHRILTEPFLMDTILRGVVSTPIESLDNAVTDELTNHLFEKPNKPFSGMDLISLNIQRARDHGIGGYNKYRAKCNLTVAKNFDDLLDTTPPQLVQKLKNLYDSVDDIDLFPGAMSERSVHGGIIGPTFGCIIAMQFSRLKRCDRFWHETNDPYIRFSGSQLAEIRKMSLAKVICDQSDSIDAIQRNAMDVSDHYLNPRVSCQSMPGLDLSVWRENIKHCVLSNKAKIELGTSKRISACRSCTCTLEGPTCRTIKVNCIKAMKTQSSINAILSDKSCLVQCAWALDMQQAL